jgi:hypothetical protein
MVILEHLVNIYTFIENIEMLKFKCDTCNAIFE